MPSNGCSMQQMYDAPRVDHSVIIGVRVCVC